MNFAKINNSSGNVSLDKNCFIYSNRYVESMFDLYSINGPLNINQLMIKVTVIGTDLINALIFDRLIQEFAFQQKEHLKLIPKRWQQEQDLVHVEQEQRY